MDNLLTDTSTRVFIITESGSKIGPFETIQLAHMHMVTANITGTAKVLNEQDQQLILG